MIVGMLVKGLRSTDWMPDRESGILNGECCYDTVVGNGEGIGFGVERRKCGLLQSRSIDCGRL